jgi:TolB-like protein
MASLIPGFEYDIFISYRQKDNKGDRWVSEFVEALKTELESTFKEEISVYFDINPHDGLLETHDVDASLKDKLKCLIFIPIISRTYYDPKSFAWEHEFKAFIDQASNDPFGLKVKLTNGNVANRVLPIQIHDLYPEDKATVEKELAGVLRSIEFIYKEPGINKPLTIDDDEKKNLNNTKYRLQVNKVANAIEEVIHGLRSIQTAPVRNLQYEQQVNTSKDDSEIKEQKGRFASNKNLKKWLVSGLLVILCIAGVFGILKVIEKRKQADEIANLEKSIAVLPFVNDSPDKENEYFCNGIMDEILNNLQKIKDFRVLSRTSVEQYRGTSKPTIPKIAKALDVNYIVEGSVQKYGSTFRLRVQLIAANNEKHLWGESYEQEIKETKDIFKIQSQVAQSIAKELMATITPEENQIITKSITPNLNAYNLFFQARNEHLKFWMDNSCLECFKKAMILYRQALLYDSTFAQAYSGLAWGYLNKNFVEGLNVNFMDSVLIYANKAIRYNDKFEEAHFIKGVYYNNTGDYGMALKEFNEAIKLNPNYSLAYYGRGNLFFNKIFDQISGFEDYLKAIQLEYGPSRPSRLKSLGGTLRNFGFPKTSSYYYDEALKLDNDSIDYLNNIAFLNEYDNPIKAIELSSEVLKRDPSNLDALWTELIIYERLRKYDEAYQIAIRIIQTYKEKEIPLQFGLEYIGYAFLKTGKIKEAESFYDEQISIRKKQLKLDPLSNNPKLTLSRIYATLGKKEESLQILNVIWKEGRERRGTGRGIMPQIYFYQLKYEPLYENLLNEPMFQNYINEVESNYKTDFEKLNLWMKNKGVLKE